MVCKALSDHPIPHAGLVLGRSPGEIGVRLPPSADVAHARSVVPDLLGVRVRPPPSADGPRHHLRVRRLPAYLVSDPAQVLAAIAPGLTLAAHLVL